MKISSWILLIFFCSTNLTYAQDQKLLEGVLGRLAHLEKELQQVRKEIVPVGIIVAWHKSFPNTPQTLQNGWVECNGQELTYKGYEASLYYGQRISNLNDNTKESLSIYNGGRFLRGGMKSGEMQEGTKHLWIKSQRVGEKQREQYFYFPCSRSSSDEDSDGTFSSKTSERGKETKKVHLIGYKTDGSIDGGMRASRPVNMTVVWIMKIK